MNNSKAITVLSDFQTSLVRFFDILAEMFPSEADFVIIRIMIKDQIPTNEVMNFFINKILPEKEIIKTRSDSFFIEKNTLFSLGPFKSNNFKTLWSTELDTDEKKMVWSWLDTFIFLVEKYIKLT